MNKIEDEDEINTIPKEPDSCETKEYGKTKKEIMKEVGITESMLKFQLDYLVKECYADIEGEICRLNEKGKDELLKNIIKNFH